jgi:hypothetical protein
VLRGAVSVDDAVQPEGARAKLQRHTDSEADDAEVEAEVEQLKATDADEKRDAFHVVAEVEVAASGDDRKRRRQCGILSRLRPNDLVSA